MQRLDDGVCPVCGGVTVRKIDTIDQGTICEEDETCINDCWEFHQSYGLYQERVRHLEWFWTWKEERPHESIENALMGISHRWQAEGF